MKKGICISVVLLILFAFTVTGFAAGGSTFEIPSLNMTVTIPNGENMSTAVTGGEYNDLMVAFLEEDGLTAEDFNAYADQNTIAFTAIDEQGAYEFSITSMKNSDTEYLYDMDVLSGAELSEVMKAASGITGMEDIDQQVLQELRDNGASLNEIDNINMDSIQKINGHNYLFATMDGSADGSDIWLDMYSTIKNGSYIYIRLISYGGPPTEEQLADLKMVVESAEYENVPASGKTYAQDKERASLNPFIKLISWVIVGAVIGAVVFAISKVKNKKKKQEAQFGMGAQMHTNQEYQPPTNNMQPPAPSQTIPPAQEEVRQPTTTEQETQHKEDK